jgi:hypothetical protein
MDFAKFDIPKIPYIGEPANLILEFSKKYILATNMHYEGHETVRISHTQIHDW